LKVARKRPRIPDGAVILSIAVNPHVRGQLRAAAAIEQITMPEKLHRILCKALNLDPSKYPSPETAAS
jgi:hypothetical protein